MLVHTAQIGQLNVIWSLPSSQVPLWQSVKSAPDPCALPLQWTCSAETKEGQRLAIPVCLSPHATLSPKGDWAAVQLEREKPSYGFVRADDFLKVLRGEGEDTILKPQPGAVPAQEAGQQAPLWTWSGPHEVTFVSSHGKERERVVFDLDTRQLTRQSAVVCPPSQGGGVEE